MLASFGYFEIFAGALAALFSVVKSYGLAIILLTVVVRLILLPLSIKQSRSMRAMQRLQPEIKKLQAKYKGNRQKLNEEMMALYKEHGANPFGGCLPLVMQFPVLIGLFYVIRRPLLYLVHDAALYQSLNHALQAKIAGVNQFLLWRLDCTPTEIVRHDPSTFGVQCGSGSALSIAPYVVLVLLMGFTTYYQQKQIQGSRPAGDPTAAQMQTFAKIMPFMLMFFAINFPTGVVFYWITTNLWTIGQQRIIFRSLPPLGDAKKDKDAGPSPKSGAKTTSTRPTSKPPKGSPSKASSQDGRSAQAARRTDGSKKKRRR